MGAGSGGGGGGGVVGAGGARPQVVVIVRAPTAVETMVRNATKATGDLLETAGSGFEFTTQMTARTATGITVEEQGIGMWVNEELRGQGIGAAVIREHLRHWQRVATESGVPVTVKVWPITDGGAAIAKGAGFTMQGTGKSAAATTVLQPR